VLPSTIQSIHMAPGSGLIRDVKGGEVFFHHSAMSLPDHFATLAVEMAVGFESKPVRKGPRAIKVTRVPKTH
jgi:cold shock CspA family protein